MHSVGLSSDGFGHILDQIFAEEMKDNLVGTPLEIQKDMVVTPRYKTGKGVTENFKRTGKSRRARLNQDVVDPEWLVCWHG